MSRKLSRNVRQERHVAGALYGESELPLEFGRHPGSLLAQNASMRIYKLFQKFRVFIINVLDAVLLEVTSLFVCHDF